MEKKNKWIKRVAIILAVAAVLFIMVQVLKAKMFPAYEGLPVSGSYTVETKTFTWEDENRIETFTDTGENRALTVRFWYPNEEGKYPLVVFSHGAFGVIDSNYSTYTELASNGYVVRDIYSYVQNKGTEIAGIVDGEYQKKFRLAEVYYFEDLDEKVFGYTKEQVFELKMRLYEVEKEYKDSHFVRCSKSIALNLMLLESISPALNGRFLHI